MPFAQLRPRVRIKSVYSKHAIAAGSFMPSRSLFRFSSLLSAACVFVLSSCTSPRPLLKSAFQDLTSETRQPEGNILQHNEVMSVIGLIPVAAPGTLVHFSNPNDATTAIGITPNPASSYLTFTFQPIAQPDEAKREMDEIRRRMRAFQRCQLELLQELDVLMSETVSKLSASEPVPGTGGPQLSVDSSNRDAIGRLFVDGKKRLQDLRMKVFDAETEVIEAVKSSNLLVTQWSARNEQSAEASLESFGTASGRVSDSVSGFWIFNGLRVHFLIVGGDITQLVPQGSSWQGDNGQIDSSKTRKLLGEVSVTTMAIQTQSSMWVSESDQLLAFQIKVRASVERLIPLLQSAGLPLQLLEQLRLDVQAAAARRSSLSNIGSLKQPTWQETPVYFVQRDPNHSVIDSLPRDNWMTIMSQSAKMGSASEQLLRVLEELSSKKKNANSRL